MKTILNKINNFFNAITSKSLKNCLRWGNIALGCMFFLTKICYNKQQYVFIMLLSMLYVCQWLYMFVYISELKEDK